jgi:ketosteroid isomerase-like protein
MSQDAVQVVRSVLAPHEGEDVLAGVREVLERFGPDPQADAVMGLLADDAGWRHYAPEIEWDMSATGLGSVARGVRELALWWGLWAAAWSTHAYQVREYRDLGDWVLTIADVQATARGDHQVAMPFVQLWQVKDGKVIAMRAFLSEADALAAAGAQA